MLENMIIPQAKTAAAREFMGKLEPILAALPDASIRQQFVVAAMSESNQMTGCTPASVVMALYHCALLGLAPGPLGLCYLVPFKGKATLIVGYRGFCELAYGTGYLSVVESDVVLKGEPWEYYRDEKGSHVHHDIGLDRKLTRDNTKAAYTTWTTRDGTHGVKVIGITEINAAAKDTPIWKQHWSEMACKTSVRRAAKLWRMSTALARAVLLDEQEERDEEQSLGVQLGSAADEREVRLDQYGNGEPPPAAEAELEPATVEGE